MKALKYSFFIIIFISTQLKAQVQPDPIVLISNGLSARVAVLNSLPDNVAGTNYSSLGIAQYSLIDNFSTTTGDYTDKIVNPNGLGGLPNNFPGFSPYSLTGISRISDGTAQPTGSTIYVSLTTLTGTHQHFILRAYKAVGATDYTVTAAIVVTASFAPANSGWVLSHIEEQYTSYSPLIGAMFTNGTGTYTAYIDPTTGIAQAGGVMSYPSTCYDALYLMYFHPGSYDPEPFTFNDPTDSRFYSGSSCGGVGTQHYFVYVTGDASGHPGFTYNHDGYTYCNYDPLGGPYNYPAGGQLLGTTLTTLSNYSSVLTTININGGDIGDIAE